MDESAVDFAIVAYRDGGAWEVVEASPGHVLDVEGITAALRRFDSEVGAIAMISVDEDFFVLARTHGDDVRFVLSDVQAVPENALAAEVAEEVGHDDDVEDDLVAIGRLDLLADLGFGAGELEMLCDDTELYPDEMLGDIAARLGFGRQFEELVG
ncbi:MAG: tRNA adenosine deaminase-associated protein [Aeromicrobium erythreum]